MLKTLAQGTGNYKKVKGINGNILYYYHGNCIGVVNQEKKILELDDCGWGGYRSTERALNDLKRMYPGYEVIRKWDILLK